MINDEPALPVFIPMSDIIKEAPHLPPIKPTAPIGFMTTETIDKMLPVAQKIVYVHGVPAAHCPKIAKLGLERAMFNINALVESWAKEGLSFEACRKRREEVVSNILRQVSLDAISGLRKHKSSFQQEKLKRDLEKINHTVHHFQTQLAYALDRQSRLQAHMEMTEQPE
jgi:hypothetical protein